VAILFEERRELAVAMKRLMDQNYPLTGASDHGVSEAIYLNDPDENGVELYCDKPKETWT
jgi:catechol 2,3-dioxygenase